MTKKEEIELLMRYKSHYLWGKPRKLWTHNDIENLRNGIDVKKANKCGVKRPVIVIKDGKQTECKSVAEASRFSGIKVQKIYNTLYLKSSQLEEIKFIFANN